MSQHAVWHVRLFQPLGLVIKANTDGTASLDARANTFVYTVLLMVITGLTMYLVYGRAARTRKRRTRLRAALPTSLPGETEAR